jgi:hypothetical protein
MQQLQKSGMHLKITNVTAYNESESYKTISLLITVQKAETFDPISIKGKKINI